MTREEALRELMDIRDEATAYPDAVCYVTSEDEDALNMAIEALIKEEYDINDLPSAQPLTAYVISDEDGNIKCSNCGSSECWGNYCMYCGAKMRGENNG